MVFHHGKPCKMSPSIQGDTPMSKETKSTKKELKELKAELMEVKSKLFDLDKEFDKKLEVVVNQLNQVSVVLDFHAHPSTQMSGRPMFLQEQYEAFMQQQQQQTPAPVSDEEEEEE